MNISKSADVDSRSREGAWIEIAKRYIQTLPAGGRSREGAWIEIRPGKPWVMVATCRSREGAWIEITRRSFSAVLVEVAPVRERGLK